jgi:hypothetical protein
MTVFNKLPQDIQEQVKADLGMYDETHVTFENGSYIVSSNVVLRNHYPTDHTYIGTYKHGATRHSNMRIFEMHTSEKKLSHMSTCSGMNHRKNG